MLMLSLAVMSTQAAPPRLEPQGRAMRLIVQDKPILLLGGELGNSSASSAAYMAPHWARLRRMHLNTVLAPVSWELIEPAEGRFVFTSVDALIRSARANDLRLVLLWFGAWKNSMSTYVPAWVKRDQVRFPRAQLPNGQGVDILSAFAGATRDADARAFAALMAHLKAVDEDRNTVIMIQVENEVGMLPVARDYSATASEKFREDVPEALLGALARTADSGDEADVRQLWKEHGSRTQGDWRTVFGQGDEAAEVFAGWHYAQYVEAVVRAGKAVYPLPMYVNVALNRMGRAPGEYPSGGPVPHLLEVWKAGAPSLDLLAPDIYFPSFAEIATRYRRSDNPLFIPEANNAERPEVPSNAFYAFGKLDAIGFAPFSIESIDERDPDPLGESYAVLEQLAPAILACQGLGKITGFTPRVLEDGTVIDLPVSETLGGYRFTVSFIDTQSPRASQSTATHGGLIIEMGPEEYLLAGRGLIVTFRPVGDGPPLAGIETAWEGTFDAHGAWVPGRLLNGDQTHQGRHLRLPPDRFGIQRVRLYRYR
jgi:beta-galactosidase GanA